MTTLKISLSLLLILVIGISSSYMAYFLDEDCVYYIANHLAFFFGFILVGKLLPHLNGIKSYVAPKIICNAGAWMCLAEIVDENLYNPLELGINDIFFITAVIIHISVTYAKYKKITIRKIFYAMLQNFKGLRQNRL